MKAARRSLSEINVVPYIDVMLVLLVIFMVTAPLTNQGFEVELPKVEGAPQIEAQDPLVLTVTADGGYRVDLGEDSERLSTLEAISNRVAVLIRVNPALVVLVRGDIEASYGAVIELLATLHESGLQNVGLLTEAPEPELPEG